MKYFDFIIAGLIIFIIAFIYFYTWGMNEYRFSEERLGGLVIQRFKPEKDYECVAKAQLLNNKVHADITCYNKNNKYNVTKTYDVVDYNNINDCLYPFSQTGDPKFTCVLV